MTLRTSNWTVRKLATPGHPFDWHRGWQRCGTLELHTAAALWITHGDGVLGLEAAAVLVSDRSPGLTLGNVRGNSAESMFLASLSL